jgi:hypothetical protein
VGSVWVDGGGTKESAVDGVADMHWPIYSIWKVGQEEQGSRERAMPPDPNLATTLVTRKGRNPKR